MELLDPVVRAWPGFVGSVTALYDAPIDWTWSVTFESEDALHSWLDSSARADALADAAAGGMLRAGADIVVVDGSEPVPGLEVIEHDVRTGQDAEFLVAQSRLIGLSAGFSGFEGASVLPPSCPGASWLSVLRFRTPRQLAAWMESETRERALPQVRRDLRGDFTVHARNTGFGSIVRIDGDRTSVTPDWKTAMLVLLVLYPTVMTLSRFLGPVLDDISASPWLTMWLSQICSVAAMTYVLMPAVTGRFRRWLDPVDGARVRVAVSGAVIVVALYALTLALFASVKWLQFWDYFD
ncbi:antibiotic biosynthesis monooxygenase [Rhodococcus sp. 1R11]|uniref:antibiotic biosynthesis monooxygenase n=1 Tax=Rhodococcus sp. 1R11 TaxID=2559614 RepID=UPI001071C10E|nr:antibiotic biosynthesis monooxygenase [Rhodococcus sp. 1R11]TFI45521.1 antibiotic biosynthesis monooxygenase [Rhodococcus sp. 1R11]